MTKEKSINQKMTYEQRTEAKKKIISTRRLPDRSELLNYEQSLKYYNEVKPRKFGSVETILLLLGITSDKPIKGKTMMMKQTFLSEKEFKLDMQDLQFVGHKFGPHSFLIENVLKNMEFVGLVKKYGVKTNQTKYYLTEDGKNEAKKLINTLSDDEQKTIKKKRVSWDELGLDGMVKFVYNNYPKYTDASVIKRRYVLVDWKKGIEVNEN
ncbi:MAG: hypothetical protein HW410_1051 [Nitrosarchaeum sp.]|nr:hypothetical protein [Nitrosarchaeum sp.]